MDRWGTMTDENLSLISPFSERHPEVSRVYVDNMWHQRRRLLSSLKELSTILATKTLALEQAAAVCNNYIPLTDREHVKLCDKVQCRLMHLHWVVEGLKCTEAERSQSARLYPFCMVHPDFIESGDCRFLDDDDDDSESSETESDYGGTPEDTYRGGGTSEYAYECSAEDAYAYEPDGGAQYAYRGAPEDAYLD